MATYSSFRYGWLVCSLKICVVFRGSHLLCSGREIRADRQNQESWAQHPPQRLPPPRGVPSPPGCLGSTSSPSPGQAAVSHRAPVSAIPRFPLLQCGPSLGFPTSEQRVSFVLGSSWKGAGLEASQGSTSPKENGVMLPFCLLSL